VRSDALLIRLEWPSLCKIGIASFAGIVAWLAGAPGTAGVGDVIRKAATLTPLFWLVAPAERVVAIICHAATRALVLLGAHHRNGGPIVLGFLIFTLLDSAAGAAQLSGAMDHISLWWFELAFAPFALISLPLLRWMWRRYGDIVPLADAQAPEPPVIAGEQGGAYGPNGSAGNTCDTPKPIPR
jgi:hypothetical protein